MSATEQLSDRAHAVFASTTLAVAVALIALLAPVFSAAPGPTRLQSAFIVSRS